MAYHYLWPEVAMLLHILVNWLVSALALWLVAQLISGIEVRDFGAALFATLVIGIVNATVGTILRILTFPLTFLTFGLFLLILDAFLLKLASLFTPGFRIRGFLAAVIGSVVLTLLSWLLRHLLFSQGSTWTRAWM